MAGARMGGLALGRWRRLAPVRRSALSVATALLLGAGTVVAASATTSTTHLTSPADDDWPGGATGPLNPAACDPVDPAQCMLPYPNDWFTRYDPTTVTKRRLDLNLLAMPRNVNGKPIDPTAWNMSDGFSAGSQILTVVPGLTANSALAGSHLPTDTDLAENADPAVGVVLLDTSDGTRWPVWTEVDQYTQEQGLVSTGLVQQDLMIHPARNLADGHHYIVALRDIRDDNGKAVPSSAAFAAYRDGKTSAADPRTAHMDDVFNELKTLAGWNRSDLYLAWDFTTASTENVTGRLLSIRNQAFAQLGETQSADLAAGDVVGSAPAFTVSSSTDYTAAQNAHVARQISGTFTVPCFIAPTCSPPAPCDTASMGTFDECPAPGQFALDPANPYSVPHQVQGQTYQANFICNVGRTSFDARRKLRPVEYGHGLFGSADEINSDAETVMADDFGMMYCATDWFGMANSDLPNAFLALSDLSNFPELTDRVQQGELDFLYLQRLMVHPRGFAADPAFWFPGGTDASASFIDPGGVYYDGNSQGGIYGGTVCAVSIDVKRCTLGVYGMDYALLLPRSSDYVATQPLSSDVSGFDPTDPTGNLGYSQVLDTYYPDQSKRMLILDLIQSLWDRSDPGGYATHMTGGLPDTPGHQVLLQMAWGDHQVANVTAVAEARTVGAELMGDPSPGDAHPALVPERYGDYQDPFWGLTSVSSYPYHGSALMVLDTGPYAPANLLGTAPPPTDDTPNRVGEDPHEYPRRTLDARMEKSSFLEPDGAVTDQLCPQGTLVDDEAPCDPAGLSTVTAPFFSWNWNGTNGL